MENAMEKLNDVIIRELSDHIDQAINSIKTEEDFSKAIEEGIESRIGQVQIKIWSELCDIYTELLIKKMEENNIKI